MNCGTWGMAFQVTALKIRNIQTKLAVFDTILAYQIVMNFIYACIVCSKM